jgi:hypothetical protein
MNSRFLQRNSVPTGNGFAMIVTDKDTREGNLLLAELAEATSSVTLETVQQAENMTVCHPNKARPLDRRSPQNMLKR